MATLNSDTLLKHFPRWLPAIIAAVSLVAGFARADSRLGAIDDRVTTIEQKGSPVDRERLAAIEAGQRDEREMLKRIDDHLNSIDESLRRSR